MCEEKKRKKIASTSWKYLELGKIKSEEGNKKRGFIILVSPVQHKIDIQNVSEIYKMQILRNKN